MEALARLELKRNEAQSHLYHEDQVLDELPPLLVVVDAVEQLPELVDGLRRRDVVRLAPVEHLDQLLAVVRQLGGLGVAGRGRVQVLAFQGFGHFRQKAAKPSKTSKMSIRKKNFQQLVQ